MKKSYWPVVFMLLFVFIFSDTLATADARQNSANCDSFTQDQFEKFSADIAQTRGYLKIPGLSAAIVCDQELIWAEGFGLADLENNIPATPDTPYGLASVTKPIGAVIIMQLVEEGLINLDDPVTEYGISLPEEGVTIRHLLTHTSENVPGNAHKYNGNRYGMLSAVIEKTTGNTFAEELSKRILLPLGMERTALNPINAWGGTNTTNLSEIKLFLGNGTEFEHYPEVYSNLAKPYQFDEEYNIVPGMYHLHHNLAAGGISSATDLARFDIALDNGFLLGDEAKAEMFLPAYSTTGNRQDLMYGLGWYIQEFDGLQMQWHTGRWQPSTSALYLKVPDKELTLIVLANTDNLTVPFPGLGSGNAATSILTLTLFRHFIFPQEHGVTLPAIDWEADAAALVNQLNTLEDPIVREFVERELWSYRQVFASAGETHLADKLYRIRIRAFPVSKLNSDWMFTQTAGTFPVIPPNPHASTFVLVSRISGVWFGLVIASLVGMVYLLSRKSSRPIWERIVWFVGTFFLGPFTLLIFLISRALAKVEGRENFSSALASSLLTVSGYGVGWAIAVTRLIRTGNEASPLLILGITYLFPLIAGLAICRLPLLPGGRHKLGRCLLTEIITVNLGFAAFFSMTMLLDTLMLGTVPTIFSPFFWIVTSIATLTAVLLLLPLHFWMANRGYNLPGSLRLRTTKEAILPSIKEAWPALLITLVIAIASVAYTVSEIG